MHVVPVPLTRVLLHLKHNQLVYRRHKHSTFHWTGCEGELTGWQSMARLPARRVACATQDQHVGVWCLVPSRRLHRSPSWDTLIPLPVFMIFAVACAISVAQLRTGP